MRTNLWNERGDRMRDYDMSAVFDLLEIVFSLFELF
jgi:hypothetical protein